MYCGNCFRDNALVAELRREGHQTTLVPLYLPMTVEDADQSVGTPIFFGGVSVYLEQKIPWFAKAPAWLHNWLSSPAILKWAAGRAAKTRAEDVGDLTVSMLRGELGQQARELRVFIDWLKTQPKPDVVCLSNALLVGMARQIRRELSVPVVITLQGEDAFLDAMRSPHREIAWKTLSERCAEVDLFIAPSRYFGDLMARRLGLAADRVSVVYNGVNQTGYDTPGAAAPPDTPALGFFARMCREKGLDTLVEAFILLKQRPATQNLRLKVGGSCGPSDEPLVRELKERLHANGCLGDAEFCTNVDRAAKIAFLKSLTVLSVPALYGEAFGLYVIEALAAGVPVVQPRHASFPELIEATGGGTICEPGDARALADAIAGLLADPEKLRALGAAGRQAARERFTIRELALNSVRAFAQAGRNFATTTSDGAKGPTVAGIHA